MNSSTENEKDFIIDSIHGDIHLSEKEAEIIDTPTFQRLRQIKQLQMSHLTYPNATHTRFAHSLGVLGIMKRLLKVAEKNISLTPEEAEDLRLAALLHDIGHYPYSHLMEGIENVNLIEEKTISTPVTQEKKTLPAPAPYPEHTPLGAKIVTEQQDIIDAIGSKNRAKRIADLFEGTVLDDRLSKLIKSSFDLDRFDYLLRDAHATGLPYGRIDLNYLLNRLQMSPKGEIGVCDRAIPAVEHFLLARYFMHRTVYYHRTTVAFEEACRQLLRRLRNLNKYGIPKDGDEIESIVTSKKLYAFTDAYVDNIIQEAALDQDDVIKYLARSIQSRNAPKLLKEVLVLDQKNHENHDGAIFKNSCYSRLKDLAKKHSLPLELFLFCELRPIFFEKEDARYRLEEVDKMESASVRDRLLRDKEIVQIFKPDSEEPCSIFDFKYSIIHKLSNMVFRIYRLYLVPSPDLPASKLEDIKKDIKDWDKLNA